eukprot:gene9130-biopygen6183
MSGVGAPPIRPRNCSPKANAPRPGAGRGRLDTKGGHLAATKTGIEARWHPMRVGYGTLVAPAESVEWRKRISAHKAALRQMHRGPELAGVVWTQKVVIWLPKTALRQMHRGPGVAGVVWTQKVVIWRPKKTVFRPVGTPWGSDMAPWWHPRV